MKMALAALLASISLQAAVPIVKAVVSSANGSPALTPNNYGTIYGSDLADSTYAAKTSPPPAKLGSTEVYVCASIANGASGTGCTFLPLLFVSPGQINFYLPPGAPTTSPQYLTVRVAGIIDSNQGRKSFDLAESVAPAIFIQGFDCYIEPDIVGANENCGLGAAGGPNRATRGAITDVLGGVISSANPARIGSYVIIWASGLGPLKTAPYVDVNLPIGPPYSNCCYAKRLPVAYAGESQYPGLYQVNLLIDVGILGVPGGYPPRFPCGSYSWDLQMGIELTNANGFGPASVPVNIPVSIRPADVSGCH